MTITCGIDWAEGHHDVALVEADGKTIAKARIDVDAAGFNELLNLIAENGGSAEHTPVAIETDKNLIVVALVGAGFTVYPINPRAVARYRERHGQAGGKSDPGDAAVLAHVLRTDLAMHRPLPAVSEQGLAIKALARQHQEAIWALNQTTSRLRSVLLEFYPLALKAFPNLKHRAATEVLAIAPTPEAALRLTRHRVVAALNRCGRRNDSAFVDRILAELKAPALRQPPAVENALGKTVEEQLRIVNQMRAAVNDLEAELAREFDSHALAPTLRSVPGLGPVLAARVLGEVGEGLDQLATGRGGHDHALQKPQADSYCERTLRTASCMFKGGSRIGGRVGDNLARSRAADMELFVTSSTKTLCPNR